MLARCRGHMLALPGALSGGRVRHSADECFGDEANLPPIFARRGIDWAVGAAVLDRLPALVQPVDSEAYASFEAVARRRIRDPQDWPMLRPRWRWPAQSGAGMRLSSAVARHLDQRHRSPQ